MEIIGPRRKHDAYDSGPLRQHHHVMVDHQRLKKLRLRIDTDDPLHLGLKKLKITGKDLSKLPAEIFHIDELEVLDLSPERQSCLYNRLTQLPPGIGRLINLRILMLDTNELTELPTEICLLTALERVSLSNNHLKVLPDAFSSLRNLRSLHCANNKLERVPLSLCELPHLEFLDLSDNMLLEVPSEIARLRNLETLMLSFNRIDSLPASLCELKELRVLWLGNNNLRRLPSNFGRLRHLDWGYRHTSSSVIDSNPMQHPPIEVCKKGVEAIARYFAAAEGARKDRESEPSERSIRTPSPSEQERNPSPSRSPDHRWERDQSRNRTEPRSRSPDSQRKRSPRQSSPPRDPDRRSPQPRW